MGVPQLLPTFLSLLSPCDLNNVDPKCKLLRPCDVSSLRLVSSAIRGIVDSCVVRDVNLSAKHMLHAVARWPLLRHVGWDAAAATEAQAVGALQALTRTPNKIASLFATTFTTARAALLPLAMPELQKLRLPNRGSSEPAEACMVLRLLMLCPKLRQLSLCVDDFERPQDLAVLTNLTSLETESHIFFQRSPSNICDVWTGAAALPQLQHLSVQMWGNACPRNAAQVAAQLSVLQPLTGLTSLFWDRAYGMRPASPDSRGANAALATLTSLTRMAHLGLYEHIIDEVGAAALRHLPVLANLWIGGVHIRLGAAAAGEGRRLLRGPLSSSLTFLHVDEPPTPAQLRLLLLGGGELEGDGGGAAEGGGGGGSGAAAASPLVLDSLLCSSLNEQEGDTGGHESQLCLSCDAGGSGDEAAGDGGLDGTVAEVVRLFEGPLRGCCSGRHGVWLSGGRQWGQWGEVAGGSSQEEEEDEEAEEEEEEVEEEDDEEEIEEEGDRAAGNSEEEEEGGGGGAAEDAGEREEDAGEREEDASDQGMDGCEAGEACGGAAGGAATAGAAATSATAATSPTAATAGGREWASGAYLDMGEPGSCSEARRERSTPGLQPLMRALAYAAGGCLRACTLSFYALGTPELRALASSCPHLSALRLLSCSLTSRCALAGVVGHPSGCPGLREVHVKYCSGEGASLGSLAGALLRWRRGDCGAGAAPRLRLGWRRADLPGPAEGDGGIDGGGGGDGDVGQLRAAVSANAAHVEVFGFVDDGWRVRRPQ